MYETPTLRPPTESLPTPIPGDALAPEPATPTEPATPEVTGRSLGKIAYGLAWLAALGLGGTAIALRFGAPYPRWTITIAVGAAALLGMAALHLAAMGLNRRRDTGLAAVTVAMVLVLLPLLAVATMFGAALSRGVDPIPVRVDATEDAVLPPTDILGPDEVPDGPAPDPVTPDPGDPEVGPDDGGAPDGTLPAEPGPGGGAEQGEPGTVG